MPATAELMREVSVPMALVVCPLAEIVEDKETPIVTVDFGEDGPMRCRKCKAYVNPFMQFTDNGMKFVCNFCNNTGDGTHRCSSGEVTLSL